MRTARNPGGVRSTTIKRYLIAKILVHGTQVCLLLAQANVLADSTGAPTACDIGRNAREAPSVDTPGSGMVGTRMWSRYMQARGNALNLDRISVLSWNIRKGIESAWDSDLSRLAAGKDLVLLQEARFDSGFYGALDPSMHRNVGRGWKQSGVLTAARAKDLRRCSYQHQEPILGTPKASLLTEFRLVGTDDTLLVVNVHVVNFAPGLSEFRKQIGDLHAVMSRHSGPMIFSGDFNTWRWSRLKTLRAFAAGLGLRAIRFSHDKRIRKLGYPLDHIFVRGLRIVSSRVESVESSDHNPLITILGNSPDLSANDLTSREPARKI